MAASGKIQDYLAASKNSCKSIIKLQALIRGYLTRKKFSQMKCDYTETVQCIEGECAQVTWRNDSKLGLPIVHRKYSDTRERVDVLKDTAQQKDGCGYVYSSSGTGRNDFNSSEGSPPVQTCITSKNDNRTERPSVSDADLESANELNKDTRSSFINEASGDSLYFSQGLNLTNKITEETTGINHIKMTQGNADQLETDEQMQTIVDGTNCNDFTEDQMLYPNDQTSLIKLREDLTMELLWIEQAIESRISYLTMKENLDKQAKGK